jgi:hypothetical protein
MRKIALFLVVFAIIYAEATPVWKNIATLDCGGQITGLPGIIGARASIPVGIFTDAINEIKRIMTCQCPDFGTTQGEIEFRHRFIPSMGPLLAAMSLGEAMPPEMMTLCPEFTSYMNFSAPEMGTWANQTCDWASWKNGDGCKLKVSVPQFSAQIVMGTKMCDNYMPYVSVHCLGADCDALLAPCSTDVECGSFTCMDPLDILPPEIYRSWTDANNYVQLGMAFAGYANMPEYNFCGTGGNLTVTKSGDYPCGAYRYGTTPKFTEPLLGFLNYYRGIFGKTPMLDTSDFKLCLPGENHMNIHPENITIADWDGVITDEAATIFDPARMTPVQPAPTMQPNVTAKIHPIMELTCDGNLFFLPNHGLEVSIGLNKINEHINAGFNMVESMEECRRSSLSSATEFGAGELNARYIVVDPAFLMFYINNNLEDFNTMTSAIRMTDLASKLFTNRPGTYRLSVPKGCRKADYMAGKCSFSIITAKNVTGLTTTFRFKIETCPVQVHKLPHIMIDCQGVGCELILRPTPCATPGAIGFSCPATTVCTDLGEMFYNDTAGTHYNPFGEMLGADDTCASYLDWTVFFKSLMKKYMNSGITDADEPMYYCFFNEANMIMDFDPAALMTKSHTTKSSKIYGIIPFCDETAGNCVESSDNDEFDNGGDDDGGEDDGTSGSAMLMPSVLTIAACLFLTGRRGLAMCFIVLVAIGSAHANPIHDVNVYNFNSFVNLTDPNVDLATAHYLDLTFYVEEWGSDWCDVTSFVARYIPNNGDWCDQCYDVQSYEITFVPDATACSAPEMQYNYSNPLRVWAQFSTRVSCMPTYLGMIRIYPVYQGWGDSWGGRYYDQWEAPYLEIYTEEDTEMPQMTNFQQSTSNVDVSTGSRNVTISFTASDNVKVLQSEVRFATCPFFRDDEPWDGDVCEEMWFHYVEDNETPINELTKSVSIVFEIPAGTHPGKYYILMNITDGCNNLELRSCMINGGAYINVADSNPDVIPPELEDFYITPNSISDDQYVQFHFSMRDNRKLRYAKFEICQDERYCRGFEVSPWSAVMTVNTDTQWVGYLNISSYEFSCGTWYMSRFEMEDGAQNRVHANLCYPFESRRVLPAMNKSFYYYDPYCYSESSGLCEGGPDVFLESLFGQAMTSEDFDPSLL